VPIELDPNFALGYASVGSDYGNLSETSRATDYSPRLSSLRGHASERERLTIAASYYQSVTGELDKAVQTYRQEIESYPRRASAYANLGVVFANQGQYEKAMEVTKQSLRLQPDLLTSYDNLANYTLALQHFEESHQMLHETQARKLDDMPLHNARYALAFIGNPR
jgi:tetratricopeptide (TPR) repeat protein